MKQTRKIDELRFYTFPVSLGKLLADGGSGLGFGLEDVEMSASNEDSWLDRWWPLLVILYGVLFVTVLVSFSPTI